MKSLRQTLEWLLPLLILVFGVLLMLSTFGFPLRNERLVALVSRPMCFFTGLLATALGILYFAAKSASRAENQRIVIAASGTAATITVAAVQDFVLRIAREFPIIASVEPQVTAHKAGPRVIVHVSLANPTNIPELARTVCERVRVGLQGDLGIEKIQAVEFNVKKILGDVRPAVTGKP